MRFLAFTVVILYTTGALCAPSDVSGCPRGSIYPHSTECSKYITCDHGKTQERTCSEKLLFDPVALVCNHAINVKCGQEKKTEDSNEIPDSKYCLSARGQFPHPTDCKKYYDCWDTTVLIRSCPEGTLFDVKKVHCGLAHDVTCKTHELEEKPVDEKEIPDKKFCLSGRGQFPHPTDCNKYYNCWDGHIVITRCPAGTAFDATKKYCVESALADCAVNRIHPHPNSVTSEEKKPGTDKKSKQSTELPDSKYCLKARGQFPHPTDCKKFYNCWDSTVAIESCSEGTLFDAITHTCGHPDAVTCNGHVPTEDNEKPDKKFCLSARGLFPHPTDCDKYYNCWDGHIVIQPCAPGTSFDGSKHHCVASALANCANKRIPYHDRSNSPKSGDAGCPRGPIYPHSTDCNKYITCGHGNIHEQKCSEGLLFDPVLLICNHAANVQCKKVPEEVEHKPDTDKKPEEPKEIPDRKYCLNARGQFPHPTDCKKYYDCWDSTVLIQTCPEGQLFDAKKIHCNFADSVTCNVHELEEKEKPTEEKEKPTEEKEIPDSKICLYARGQYPHPTDCKKYYNCWDGQIVITKCPVGTAFDASKHYCVESGLAHCKSNVKRIHYRASNGHQKIALSLSLQKTVQELDDFDDDKYIKGVRIFGHKCPADRGQFAHESACKMYYNCWDEVVLLQRCPNGLLFEPVKRICDSPDRVNCHGKFNPNDEDKKDVVKVKCNVNEGLMANPRNCRTFYICVAGLGSEFTCPANLLFDVNTMACGYPEDAKCAGSISDEGNQQNENPGTKIDLSITGFKCEGRADGLYETNECRIFIKCVAGRSYQYVCPANLVYDTKIKRCEYAENVARSCNNKV